MVVLLAFAALLLGPDRGAGAQDNTTAERTGDAVVGASVAVPEDWSVERERYTSDGTYGFTLWEPQEDPEAARDHGGDPGMRVALAPELEPGEIEGRVSDRLAELSDVPAKRATVRVGEGKHRGVAVGPIPGSTPSIEVYVAVDGRVYQINAYGERLDAAAKKLLSTLEFDDPSRSVASLRLPDGESSAAFAREDGELIEQEEAARREALADTPEGARTASAAAKVPAGKEKRIDEGCWKAAGNFFVQTQHGERANARSDDGIGKGWTIIGRPNFWGQYTHGNLDYGRCVSTYYVNDKFAIDYPLNSGDVVFSPFESGTVTFAGRNNSHKNFGIFVIIKADNGGKYVSMSAHLTALASGIRPGARVTDETVIGFAGSTGDSSIAVGEVHLHQAFYRYPKYLADGSPYGGAGLQVVNHHYVGTAAGTGPGVYKFGWERNSTTKSEGDSISN